MESKNKASENSWGRVPLKWGEGTTELNSDFIFKRIIIHYSQLDSIFPWLNHMALYMV